MKDFEKKKKKDKILYWSNQTFAYKNIIYPLTHKENVLKHFPTNKEHSLIS